VYENASFVRRIPSMHNVSCSRIVYENASFVTENICAMHAGSQSVILSSTNSQSVFMPLDEIEDSLGGFIQLNFRVQHYNQSIGLVRFCFYFAEEVCRFLTSILLGGQSPAAGPPTAGTPTSTSVSTSTATPLALVLTRPSSALASNIAGVQPSTIVAATSSSSSSALRLGVGLAQRYPSLQSSSLICFTTRRTLYYLMCTARACVVHLIVLFFCLFCGLIIQFFVWLLTRDICAFIIKVLFITTPLILGGVLYFFRMSLHGLY